MEQFLIGMVEQLAEQSIYLAAMFIIAVDLRKHLIDCIERNEQILDKLLSRIVDSDERR